MDLFAHLVIVGLLMCLVLRPPFLAVTKAASAREPKDVAEVPVSHPCRTAVLMDASGVIQAEQAIHVAQWPTSITYAGVTYQGSPAVGERYGIYREGTD